MPTIPPPSFSTLLDPYQECHPRFRNLIPRMLRKWVRFRKFSFVATRIDSVS